MYETLTPHPQLSKDTVEQLHSEEHRTLISSRFISFDVTDDYLIIWLDAKLVETDTVTNAFIKTLQHLMSRVRLFNDTNVCIDFLTGIKGKQVLMIISADLYPSFVSLIEDLVVLHSIYVFSDDAISSSQCIVEHGKTKGMFHNLDELSRCLKGSIFDRFNNDYTSYSILPSTSTMKLNELDQSFMYSQLLKEMIIDIGFDEEAKSEFVDFCCAKATGDQPRLQTINNFDMNYKAHTPIWWYTKETFIYTTLNQAFCKQGIMFTNK
jgi:hypothetical protein